VFSRVDTIVAIATPPGRGGIGVVRLSGPSAAAIAQALTCREQPFEPRRATLARVASVDSAVVTVFPAPGSYTGDEVVEVSAHGSPVVLGAIVKAAMDEGARLAEPGEFTFRAFLNGRLDLAQAEAVADLVEAVTPLQARAAFDQLQGTLSRAVAAIDATLFDIVARLEASVDFPEEGYHFADPKWLSQALDTLLARLDGLLAGARRGRLVREGVQIAIVGKPNVGKSSLFNALIGASRAIVTDVPGTTRDLVTEVTDLDGLRATIVDTAGLRDVADTVEAEGVARARGAGRTADLVLTVLDASRPLDDLDRMALEESAAMRRLVVLNKSDLPPVWDDLPRQTGSMLRADRAAPPVRVSAVTGTGLDQLRRAIAAALDAEPTTDCPSITNLRHIALVERARTGIARALEALAAAGGSLSEEFVLADLQEARAALEEISGRRTTDDVLTHIFERFCIGK
jgi:tRNA modification GTPase